MGTPLKKNFRKGQSLSALPADYLNTVARILDDLKAVGLDLKKTSSGLGWTLTLKVDETTLTFGTDGITIEVKDSGVDTAQIAADAVDKTKIDADVAGDGIAQNVDGSLELTPDGTSLELSGDTLQVKALGIDTAELAAIGVTTAKIAANAVDSTKTTGASKAATLVPGWGTVTVANGLITVIV